MKLINLLFYFNIYVICACGSVNYCGSKMCGYTDNHTFCQYPPGPGPSCIGFTPSSLSMEEKARILARLNKRRSETARGLRGFLPAGDMLKLRWVEELEREAGRWADQCRPPSSTEEHDVCRDLYAISVGQCVASVVGEAPGLRPESMVDMWFMQNKYYHGNVTKYVPSPNESYYYDDFAQMIWSRTYLVGCGRSKFMVPWRGRLRSVWRLVCNFAPRGPVESRPLWHLGSPTSACPLRSYPDPDMFGLCTYQVDMVETSIVVIKTPEELQWNLLLEAVIDLEKNISDNTIGKLDQTFLTKLAMATIDLSTPTQPYNFDNVFANKNKLEYNADNDFKFTSYKNKRDESRLLGRPKSYNIEDLNDSDKETVANTEKNVNFTHNGEEIYDNYENHKKENFTEPKHIIIMNDGKNTSIQEYMQDVKLGVKNSGTIAKFAHEMISNLTIADFLNESSVNEEVVEDYLSNPETAKELQAAIEIVERKLSPPMSASNKTRREIRSIQEERAEKNLALLREIERNKTRDRGPMLSMAMKYIPYLKEYEKSIVGGANSKQVCVAPLILLTLITQRFCNI